jgi:hypothetical protein
MYSTDHASAAAFAPADAELTADVRKKHRVDFFVQTGS